MRHTAHDLKKMTKIRRCVDSRS